MKTGPTTGRVLLWTISILLFLGVYNLLYDGTTHSQSTPEPPVVISEAPSTVSESDTPLQEESSEQEFHYGEDWACAPELGDTSHLDEMQVEHVLVISVDGLIPSAIEMLGEEGTPVFHRLINEGSSTLNARSSPTITLTIPNHTGMITSRLIQDDGCGHRVDFNSDQEEVTIHSHRGMYVPSVFDVAHDNGFSTAMIAGKSKFSMYNRSYDGTHGWNHNTGSQGGDNKIDLFFTGTDTEVSEQLNSLLSVEAPSPFVFIHFANPDRTGHNEGFALNITSPYLESIRMVDRRLGQIISLVEENESLNGRTTLIITSDHGGVDTHHNDNERAENYTIPFIVWGPGVDRGADLYALNTDRRIDPGTTRGDVSLGEGARPIYNGEVGNLALFLLGLNQIPGSTLGVETPLRLSDHAEDP